MERLTFFVGVLNVVIINGEDLLDEATKLFDENNLSGSRKRAAQEVFVGFPEGG